MGSVSEGSLSHAPDLVLRVQYASYLFVSLIVILCFRGFFAQLLSRFSIFQKGCDYAFSGSKNYCAVDVIAYRVSFALTMFFFLHLLSVSDLTCCIQSQIRVVFQKKFFFAKTICLVLLIVVTFWIPNSFFAMYAHLCLFASGLFLLMNVVFLVDFSYHWSEEWGQRAENASKWAWYLLIVTLLCYLAGAGINIASFVIYTPHADCHYNTFAITSIIVSAVIFTGLSIWVPHGSLMPSSIVFLYSSGIMFITLRSGQNPHCNRLAAPDEDTLSIKQMIVMSFVSSLALGYSVVSAGGNGSLVSVKGDDEDEDDPDKSGHLSQYMFFYTTMLLGSMYLAMLATNWHVNGMGKEAMKNSSNIAFWVRSATVWSAVLLYMWSLVAPYFCCKDRDFGYDADNW